MLLNITALFVFWLMTVSVLAVSLKNLRDYYDELSQNWKALLVVNVLLYSSHGIAYLILSWKNESIYFSHHKVSWIHVIMLLFTFIVSVIMSMLKGYEVIDHDMYYFMTIWNWIYSIIQVFHLAQFAHNKSMLREPENGDDPQKNVSDKEPVPEMPTGKQVMPVLIKTATLPSSSIDLQSIIQNEIQRQKAQEAISSGNIVVQVQ
jgi:hypothetical protein